MFSAVLQESQAALRDQTAAASSSGRVFQSASGRQGATAAERDLNKTWQYPAWLGPSWGWQEKVCDSCLVLYVFVRGQVLSTSGFSASRKGACLTKTWHHVRTLIFLCQQYKIYRRGSTILTDMAGGSRSQALF